MMGSVVVLVLIMVVGMNLATNVAASVTKPLVTRRNRLSLIDARYGKATYH